MFKAILVGASLHKDQMLDYYMEELENLAKASNVDVVYSMTQQLKGITARFYIGSGKVDEIKTYVDNLEADMVIFNNELSGRQIRNIEEVLDCRVVDRTLLILDIFAKRAKTKEAMLQVEIAQLNYLRTRLVGMTTSLNRQQGGIGSKGPGEKKLELDKRRIDHERYRLESELEEVVKARQVQRKNRNRSSIKKVAIVGYTNAGKSTLLNTLIKYTNKDLDKQVYVEDMLFATLETSTRQVQLSNQKKFIITDTVGFVSNLPHNLVDSFKSTLEEITEADYLIHVVDSSNEFHDNQIEVTNNTLKEIGVRDIPTLYVYNKADLLLKDINLTNKPSVVVSLVQEDGIKDIINFIDKELFDDFETLTLLVPYSEGDVLAYLTGNANIIKQDYINEGTMVTVELSPSQKESYSTYIQK